MKAVVARAYGPPESLRLEELELAPPGPDEVRVAVHYAGVSFVDVLVAAGKHQYKPPLPYIPCSEFSGEVLETGANVSHVSAGDRVCGGRMGGILAEQVCVPASRVQKLPDGACMQRAAVLRASYLTAWYSLAECAGLAAGENVLVLGAAGAVGIASCQTARHLGATVIASASSAEKRQFALQHGADFAIDTHAADWREQVRELTAGRGLNVVVDPVGGDATERAFRALAYKGRHIVVGFAAGTIPQLPANLPLLKGAALVGALTQNFEDREPQRCLEARDKLLQLFGAGILQPPIGRVYPLEDFLAALEAARSGDLPGRVLVRMIR